MFTGVTYELGSLELYFNTSFELLRDECYCFVNYYKYPYNIFNVTDKVMDG